MQRLGVVNDDTMLKTEAEYSINFTELRKTFCLGLYYNAF